jgi:6-phosphogluconolactonase
MRSGKPQNHIAADAEELSHAAAAEFVRRACEAVHAQGVFRVALAGGSTPKSLYALLAGEGAF